MKPFILVMLIGAVPPIAPAMAQGARTCGLAPYQLRASRGDTPGIGCRISENDVAHAGQSKAHSANDAERRYVPKIGTALK